MATIIYFLFIGSREIKFITTGKLSRKAFALILIILLSDDVMIVTIV